MQQNRGFLGGAEADTAYPFPRLPQNITNWIVN